jgi:hypothetical protein
MIAPWHLLVLILGWLFFAEVPLHAYLDPGSGSMLLQLLLGGLAGAGVVLRLFWRRLRARLGRPGAEQEPPAGTRS